MADKKEMSLDEVLSSIKKMVVDSEPPVLDLTDMVAEDGSIVKVGENNEVAEEGMGTFLQLAHDNADDELRKEQKHEKTDSIKEEIPIKTEEDLKNESQPKEENHMGEEKEKVSAKSDVMVEIFREIAAPEVKKWLEAKLPQIASKEVQPVINQWLDDNVRRWLDENLPQLAGNAIEKEIRNLLNKNSK